MNKDAVLKVLTMTGVLVAALVIAFFLYQPKEANGDLSQFAMCLTDKATMYGADWCPHCADQKKMFDDAFKFITYVECPDNPQECLAKNIQGYPTWIFSDATVLQGVQSLETLSQKTGCALP